MRFSQLKAYFEDIAAIHVDIRHTAEQIGFVAVHAEDSADEVIKKLSAPVNIVLITSDKKLFPPKGENFNWDKNICFMVLTRLSRKSVPEIVDAQDNCELVADDIFTMLNQDRYTKLFGFQPETFVMQPVGPVSSDYYGQVCMFQIADNFSSEVNPARWL